MSLILLMLVFCGAIQPVAGGGVDGHDTMISANRHSGGKSWSDAIFFIRRDAEGVVNRDMGHPSHSTCGFKLCMVRVRLQAYELLILIVYLVLRMVYWYVWCSIYSSDSLAARGNVRTSPS